MREARAGTEQQYGTLVLCGSQYGDKLGRGGAEASLLLLVRLPLPPSVGRQRVRPPDATALVPNCCATHSGIFFAGWPRSG